MAMASNSNAPDGHGCDGDSGWGTLGCCCFSICPRSVLTSAVHDHAPNRVCICSSAFDMINAVDTDDAVAAFDRNPSPSPDT